MKFSALFLSKRRPLDADKLREVFKEAVGYSVLEKKVPKGMYIGKFLIPGESAISLERLVAARGFSRENAPLTCGHLVTSFSGGSDIYGA